MICRTRNSLDWLDWRMPLRYKIAKDTARMNKSTHCLAAVTMLVAGVLLFADPALAQEAKFDSDTISGLGARNIGSAAMSGRVAANAAVKENGRLTVYVGAASGGVWQLTRKAWDAANGDSGGTGGAPSAAFPRGSLPTVRGLMP